MNEFDQSLTVSEFDPATDALAHVMRWVGLVAGIGIFAWALAAATV
ncbi:hypothetical protein [Microvirga antarctica]|nr:hypothetical protein [Microvirga antarctica]